MDERRRDEPWRQLGLEGPETDTVWDRLRTACVMVRHHVHVDAVAATITSRGPGTTVATDRWAQDLEDYQHTLGEGPGPEVVRSGLAVLVPDMRRKQRRWPVLAGRAAAHGVAAVFTVPLPDTRGNPLGTLALYRGTTGPLSTAELRHTAVMAGFMAKLVDLDESPREPAAARIAAATDLLASRHAMSREDALVLLRAHAYVRDRPLHEIAAAVVDEDLWRTSLDDDGR